MKAVKLFDVTGQVAFVTGAASGLGFAMAEVLAEHGARVTMADIDGAALETRVRTMREAGCAVEAAVLDVTDSEALRHRIDALAKQHGRLDAVFANAGISSGPGFGTVAGRTAGQIDHTSLATWEKLLDMNLTSVFVTLQAAAAHMKPQKSGRLIVTSSIAGLRADSLVGYPYAVTKAALHNLVRQAAKELAPYNVLVNAIAPGVFFTRIAGGKLHDPAVYEEFRRGIPLGRIAEPEEIKGLALFLASPASSYLTG
ncbi:MAG: SDR family oxidoreductase, partial [Betaproteobacteria bacterium]|nr:SDR family oxidoreductase [Betaproteobacteria bacterium]